MGNFSLNFSLILANLAILLTTSSQSTGEESNIFGDTLEEAAVVCVGLSSIYKVRNYYLLPEENLDTVVSGKEKSHALTKILDQDFVHSNLSSRSMGQMYRTLLSFNSFEEDPYALAVVGVMVAACEKVDQAISDSAFESEPTTSP